MKQTFSPSPLSPQTSKNIRPPDQTPTTFYIKTYGCQMNELDSEVMAGILERKGLSSTQNEQEADLLIFNTCSIRDLAERKAMGKIGQVSRHKNNRIIGVAGCMANNKKESLFRKLPSIDFVVGTNNLHELSNIIDEVLITKKPVQRTEPSFYEELNYADAKRKSSTSAYVSIIRGCDKYCTYCIVPYTRGPEVSRPYASIIDEIKILADKGVREVTLLGQNVNSYGKDIPNQQCLFHDLLVKIDAIEGIERIRFMTSHPVDITEDLMHAIAQTPSVCELVHFPVQSGSERVLKKMHRIYTKDEYLHKVELLKKIVPNVALGTDIIVGFPTETDEDFQESYDIMKQIDYHLAFIFAYSERKGAPAARWRDDIPEEIKQQRLQKLLKLHDASQKRHRQNMLNTTVNVLIEGTSAKDPSYLQGRTRCWKNIIFKGSPNLIGQLVDVNIHSFSNQTLIGEITS